MLIHDRFVFIHHQKCGGTFIRQFLKQELGSDALAESVSHATWRDIPAEAAGRPVLCYVRNPWDWYVSWYEFKVQKPQSRGQLFNRLADDGRSDFAQTIRNACAWRMPRTGDADLCTASFLLAGGDGVDSPNLTVGRFERLADDLEQFLAAAGVELPEGALGRAHAAEPVNASERRPYRDYYDEELRDLVARSSRMLIERFDYDFNEANRSVQDPLQRI